MKPGTTRQFFLVLATLVVVGVLLALVLETKQSPSAPTPTVQVADSEEVEKVIPSPVYESNEIEDELTHPLFLVGDEKGSVVLTEETKEKIADFKAKVLARVTSPKELSDAEKVVLSTSISKEAKPSVGVLVVANQTILRFTPEELALIEGVLTQ